MIGPSVGIPQAGDPNSVMHVMDGMTPEELKMIVSGKGPMQYKPFTWYALTKLSQNEQAQASPNASAKPTVAQQVMDRTPSPLPPSQMSGGIAQMGQMPQMSQMGPAPGGAQGFAAGGGVQHFDGSQPSNGVTIPGLPTIGSFVAQNAFQGLPGVGMIPSILSRASGVATSIPTHHGEPSADDEGTYLQPDGTAADPFGKWALGNSITLGGGSSPTTRGQNPNSMDRFNTSDYGVTPAKGDTDGGLSAILRAQQRGGGLDYLAAKKLIGAAPTIDEIDPSKVDSLYDTTNKKYGHDYTPDYMRLQQEKRRIDEARGNAGNMGMLAAAAALMRGKNGGSPGSNIGVDTSSLGNLGAALTSGMGAYTGVQKEGDSALHNLNTSYYQMGRDENTSRQGILNYASRIERANAGVRNNNAVAQHQNTLDAIRLAQDTERDRQTALAAQAKTISDKNSMAYQQLPAAVMTAGAAHADAAVAPLDAQIKQTYPNGPPTYNDPGYRRWMERRAAAWQAAYNELTSTMTANPAFNKRTGETARPGDTGTTHLN